MRVIHVITTIELGGAEKQLLTLITEQVKMGHVVQVFYLKGIPALEAEILSVGASVSHKLANRSFLSQLLMARRLFLFQNVLLHAHLPQAEVLASLTRSSNRLVITRHTSSYLALRLPHLVSRLIAKFTSSRADAVIAISKAAKDFLISSREIANRTPITVIHYAFNTPKNNFDGAKNIDIRNHLQITNSDFVIETIARLVPGKDYPTLLESFKTFYESNTHALLIVAGVGPFEAEYKDIAIKLDISHRVRWLGKRNDVKSLLQVMDIFVLTSKSEGFGLVILEAMVESVPVVASNNTAIPEILGQDYPYLVQTGCPSDFSEAFESLTKLDNRERAQLLLKSRLIYFEPEKMGSETHFVYLNAIKFGRKRRLADIRVKLSAKLAVLMGLRK